MHDISCKLLLAIWCPGLDIQSPALLGHTIVPWPLKKARWCERSPACNELVLVCECVSLEVVVGDMIVLWCWFRIGPNWFEKVVVFIKDEPKTLSANPCMADATSWFATRYGSKRFCPLAELVVHPVQQYVCRLPYFKRTSKIYINNNHFSNQIKIQYT